MKSALAIALVVGWIVPAGCSPVLGPHLATPSVLPEPTVEPQPSSLRYVALGDSYTIGTSVAEHERWPNQLVAALADRASVELVANLGVNGASSDDLIAAQLPQLGSLAPDFVTLLIGVNDVVRGVPAQRYSDNIDLILGAILDHVPSERIVVVSTPDYTLTPAANAFGDPDQQRAAIEAFNLILERAAMKRRIAYVDISPVANEVAIDRSLVAGDGLHPSGAQYARWVELIAPPVRDLLER